MCELFETIKEKEFKKDEEIKIYLKFKNEIDMSYMFNCCDKLLSVHYLDIICNDIDDSIKKHKENELSSSLLSNIIDINLDDKYDKFYGVIPYQLDQNQILKKMIVQFLIKLSYQ